MSDFERLRVREIVFPDNKALTKVGEASFTFDPGNLIDAAGETKADIAVAGAAFGDFVLVAAPYTLAGITVTGYVHAANTIGVRVQNESGGVIDLASGTWKVLVFRTSALGA